MHRSRQCSKYSSAVLHIAAKSQLGRAGFFSLTSLFLKTSSHLSDCYFVLKWIYVCKSDGHFEMLWLTSTSTWWLDPQCFLYAKVRLTMKEIALNIIYWGSYWKLSLHGLWDLKQDVSHGHAPLTQVVCPASYSLLMSKHREEITKHSMRLYSYSILHFHDVEGLGRDQVFFLKKQAKSKQERPSCSDRGAPGAC